LGIKIRTSLDLANREERLMLRTGVVILLGGWLLTPWVWGELPRPGIECGCHETGAYIVPKIKQLVQTAPGYRVIVEGADSGPLVLTVTREGEVIKRITDLPLSTQWGFGPDGRRLLVFYAGNNQQMVELHDLVAPARWEKWVFGLVDSQFGFSPRGRWVVAALLTAPTRGALYLIDAVELRLTGPWNFDFDAPPGGEADRFGLAAWGFSPDEGDSVLLYAYGRDGGVRVNTIDAYQSRRGIEELSVGNPGRITFSPCGDVVAVESLPAEGLKQLYLLGSLHGNVVGTFSALAAAYDRLYATSDEHCVECRGSVYRVDNTAGEACGSTSEDPPVWVSPARLETFALRSTSLGLKWTAARSDGAPLAFYEVFQEAPENRLLAQVPADDDRQQVVTDLIPETEYRFSVRAWNLAEIPSVESLSVTVTTLAPASGPDWPLNAKLQAVDIGERSLRLIWPGAVDDRGVERYRLSRDGVVFATTSEDARDWVVDGLQPATRYQFEVVAEDGDQLTSRALTLSLYTLDLTPPTWPLGSRIYAGAATPTSVQVEWTEAIDNVGVTEYGLFVIVDGVAESLGSVSSGYVISCLRPGSDITLRVEAGDEAGNWSQDGPQETLVTVPGIVECGPELECASVSSFEAPAQGVWVEAPGPGWGRVGAADSEQPALSGDGRYVAFASSAVNLVEGDGNSHSVRWYETTTYNGFSETWSTDIFVRDRHGGLTERVSLRPGGDETPLGVSHRNPAISGDGGVIVFESWGGNYLAGDANSLPDIVLRDRRNRRTELISATVAGQSGNSGSTEPGISADGRWVVFRSEASNLVEGDKNGEPDILLYDRVNGEMQRVNLAADGGEANDVSWGPAISADGRWIAYGSAASNLVPDDQNGRPDVFLWDRGTSTTWCVSRNLAGLPGNRSSCSDNQEGVVNPTRPAISADGRYVAFDSWADDLVPNDTNGRRDIFVFDRLTGITTRASVSTEGEQATGWWEWSGQSWEPAISGDGRLIAFTSNAINLVEDGLSGTGVFLHDLATGVTARISACTCSESPAQPDDQSLEPAFSGDHHILAFRSLASNLVPGRRDLNFSSDIFVYECVPGPADRDHDGIPDAEERGPGGNDPYYDGNRDGIPDADQRQVISVFAHDGRQYVTFENLAGNAPPRVVAIENPSPADMPTGAEFPVGCFQIQVTEGVEPGVPVRVALYLPEDVQWDSYFKHGPTFDESEPHWYEFMFDGETGAIAEPGRVVLQFIDGERGDSDRAENSAILDPGGPIHRAGLEPPLLVVSPGTLIFAAGESHHTIQLCNEGLLPLTWGIDGAIPSWLWVDPAAGSLGGGETEAATIEVERAGLSPGVYRHDLQLTSGGGRAALAVTLEVEFMITRVEAGNDGTVRIGWSAFPGSAYRLEGKGTLADPAWVDLSPRLIAEGPAMEWRDYARAWRPIQFYRVRSD
jgi:Tol biopolymer transport system component